MVKRASTAQHGPAETQNETRHPMIPLFKRLVVPLCLTALLALVSLGCRTANGFGQDMEKAGEKIQDGTK